MVGVRCQIRLEFSEGFIRRAVQDGVLAKLAVSAQLLTRSIN